MLPVFRFKEGMTEEEDSIVSHILRQSQGMEDEEARKTVRMPRVGIVEIDERAQSLLKAYWLFNRRGRFGLDSFNVREVETLKSLATASAVVCGRRTATESDALVSIYILEESLLWSSGTSLLGFHQQPTLNLHSLHKGRHNDVSAAARAFRLLVLSFLVEP